MENFKNEIAELLEVDSVQDNDSFESFDAWDSLTILSIIALVDEKYGITISAKEINDAKTVETLIKYIQSKQA
jgi:acyl carrier protein